MVRRTQLICYTTPTVAKLAKRLATRNNRTVSNYIEQLIIDAGERHPREDAETTESRAKTLLGDE